MLPTGCRAGGAESIVCAHLSAGVKLLMPTTTVGDLLVRSFRPGDESAQAEIYNAATTGLPGFKAARADEIARRYRTPDFDATSKFFAEVAGRVVAYATFSPNGRVSVPWCLPDASRHVDALFGVLLGTMRERGLRRAWAAYRDDWIGVREFLHRNGFDTAYEMLNYVTATANLFAPSASPVQSSVRIHPIERNRVSEIRSLEPTAFGVETVDELAAAWFDNPYFSSESLFGLSDSDGRLRAAGLLVTHPKFADPNAIDSAMPCFRLGAFGTEQQRTKRVNGLFTYVAEREYDRHWSAVLLGEARRRLEVAGVTNVGAQCRSNRTRAIEFYDRHFQRQRSFPIYAREL